MASRFWTRLWVLARAIPSFLSLGRRERPTEVRRILVAHHLLLGDTIMLVPLLQKVRSRYPAAEIVMLCNPAYVSLFHNNPYDVTVRPHDPRSLLGYRALVSDGGFDLALIPGDNRWSWLARGLGARWVVAFETDRWSYTSWPVDEFVKFPNQPEAWGDITTRLVDGNFDAVFATDQWSAPRHKPFDLPPRPYCVFHLGASSPHKFWPTENWRKLASWVASRGLNVVLSTGKGEISLAQEVDPQNELHNFAGRLDLPQLWHLLAHAEFLVCPDTGIAHLARIVGTPTVALFGPGSPIVSGAGRFWRNSNFIPTWIATIQCRDQSVLFKRELPWVRRCARSVRECGHPICMFQINIDQVQRAIEQLKIVH